MKSHLLLFVFISIAFTISAQKKSYTDYYFEAKTLTDTLKTYQILVQAHDETYPFVSDEYVKNEVLRSFNFLNIKKRVEKDPDFLIKIIAKDVEADVDYVYNGINNTYEIVCNYDVSFALAFEKDEKPVVYIPLCTRKHYEKRFPYSVKNTGFDPDAGKFQLIRPDENKPIHKYVEELEVLLNTKGVFILDFNEVLVAFRKKK